MFCNEIIGIKCLNSSPNLILTMIRNHTLCKEILKTNCPLQTLILTFGSPKADISIYFSSIKNISKGKTSTPNSSILIVYGTKPPFYEYTLMHSAALLC